MENTEFKIGDIVQQFHAGKWLKAPMKITNITKTGRYTVDLINEDGKLVNRKVTVKSKSLRKAA